MTRARDRGQVLLIGAIAIAFVFLGLVTVFNGAVYTETTSSSASGQERGAAEATEHGLLDGVRHIAETAWNEDEFEFESGFDREVTEYVERYQRTNAAGGTALVDAEINVVEDEREVRRFSGDQTGSDGKLRFDGKLPKFDLETGQHTETQEIVVTAVPPEGETTEITIEPTDDGTVSFESNGSHSCTVDASAAEFDLVTGDTDAAETASNDCESGVLESGVAYESVTVDPTTDAVLGSYDVVTKDSDTRVQTADPTGVEFVELALRYDSIETTTERTHAIFGFGDGR